jgi:uncharacterized protein YkwD
MQRVLLSFSSVEVIIMCLDHTNKIQLQGRLHLSQSISERVDEHQRNLRGKRESVNRILVQSSNVKLINNCGFDVSIGIIYYGVSSKKVYIWPTIKKSSNFLLSKVTSSTVYLYGFHTENPKKRLWGTGKSQHCITMGECLQPFIVGSLERDMISFKLCATSAPTARPISKAPPYPTSLTTLSEIDKQWLDGHNSRRSKYFAKNGLSAKNLKWSTTLEKSAQNNAIKLLELGGDTKCTIVHGYKGDNYGGENIASNWGISVSTVSASPEEVLDGWFDKEIVLPYGANGHATQVVFRSTNYIGCGQSKKNLSNGGKCYINVCRYLSPGNCNMTPEGWKTRTLDDTALCPPLCPEEGCF